LKVTARYYNIIRDIAGVTEQALDLPDDASALSALQALSEHHGPTMSRLLLDAGGGKSIYLSLFLNGKRLADADLARRLSSGDELMLMPAIAGG
jgi:molybdopterin converting factor small subunit